MKYGQHAETLYIVEARDKTKNSYSNIFSFSLPITINQSAEGAGGLGIITGNKVGDLSRDSNVEFAL